MMPTPIATKRTLKLDVIRYLHPRFGGAIEVRISTGTGYSEQVAVVKPGDPGYRLLREQMDGAPAAHWPY